MNILILPFIYVYHKNKALQQNVTILYQVSKQFPNVFLSYFAQFRSNQKYIMDKTCTKIISVLQVDFDI